MEHVPFYVPINATTKVDGDHSRNAAGAEVLTLAPDNIMPAFTDLELFWDFEGHPAANMGPFRPVPWERDPFELEALLVRLNASGPKPVVFNPEVDPLGLWNSVLPAMPIEHYRRLLADVGPALDELVVAYIEMYGGQPQEAQGLKIGVRPLFSRLAKVISSTRAHIEKRKADKASSSKE
jgi:hypothetical protein